MGNRDVIETRIMSNHDQNYPNKQRFEVKSSISSSFVVW